MEVQQYSRSGMRSKLVAVRLRSGLALLSSLALGAWLSAEAQAQAPSAGRAIRDIEATQPALPAPADEVELDLPAVDQPQAATDTAGMRLLVKAFVIQGNQAFSSEALQQLLADLPGHELDLNGLRAAAERITAHYQAHGYILARAFLPAQEIDAGVVHIEVMEGRYGRIELHNDSRALDRVVRSPLSALSSGSAVHGADLERSLLLLNDLPGVKAKGTLRAGQQPGTTDLRVEARPGPWASGSLEADNFGGYHTGEYRLGGSFNLNNPLRLGDQLSLRVLGSDRDQRYLRSAYQLPVGPWSTRLGAAYSQMDYELNRKRFKRLEMNGRASVQSVFVVQPLVRSRSFDLSAQLHYENKHLRDDIDLFELSQRKQIELWTLSLEGSRQDLWFGGGYSQFSLAYGSGQLRFDDAAQQRADRLSAGTGGSFARTNLQLARTQRLGQGWFLRGQLHAQWAASNLDSSEKMSLGGPYGVRGYPQSAGAGDQGWLAGLELGYALTPRWQLGLFTDRGYVEINRLPWTDEANTQRLQSAGLGARWAADRRQLSLSSAWPLDGHRAGDGPQRLPRVWVSAAQYF